MNIDNGTGNKSKLEKSADDIKAFDISDTGSEMSKSIGKNSKSFDIAPKIICAFIAIIIWFYVMQVDSTDYTEEISGVDVILSNTSLLENERSLYVYSGYGYAVDVTVSGKKSTINKISSSDISATVDLKDITAPGEYKIPLNITLPTGLVLEDSDYNEITVYIDEKKSETFSIKPKAIGANYSGQYEYGDLVAEYDTVIVTGPKNVIDNIDYAVAEADFSSIGIIDETTSSVRKISLIDKDGNTLTNPYLKLSRSEVKVTIPVSITKEVPLTVSYLYGYYNDKNVKITFSPSTVSVKGDPAKLSSVKSINVTQIDEKAISGDTTLAYILEDTEDYTIIGDKNVNIEITHIGTIAKTFSVNNFVVNAGANTYEVLTNSIDVTLRGSAVALSGISAEDIFLNADISGFSKDYSGEVKAVLTVSVKSEDAAGIYEIGTYSAQFKVN